MKWFNRKIAFFIASTFLVSMMLTPVVASAEDIPNQSSEIVSMQERETIVTNSMDFPFDLPGRNSIEIPNGLVMDL